MYCTHCGLDVFISRASGEAHHADTDSLSFDGIDHVLDEDHYVVLNVDDI